jgi:N-sulfoglucosamine sulfohydrolase
VQRADKGLVRLIGILKETGHWHDTLVIYISDNGIAFPGAKTTLYEPGIRLPCVVRNPYAKKKGIATNAMVTWADITPTILDFAGTLPEKQNFHGRSFLQVLQEENPKGWDEIYASHTFHEITMYYPMRVVRTRRYKLIWNIAHKLDYPFASDLWASSTWQAVLKSGDKVYGKRSIEAYIHRPKFEIYDLENDPHEINNLADDPKHAQILEELKQKLKVFQKLTKDPWILKWKYE